jgi:hypothetical protein
LKSEVTELDTSSLNWSLAFSGSKHSANSVKAAGDQARHGVEEKAPPVDPMTITEAKSLVDILLARWLGSIAV